MLGKRIFPGSFVRLGMVIVGTALNMIAINEQAAASAYKRSSHELTRWEQQVLDLLVKGLGNRQIAEGLELKTATVTSHLKSIYKKLGLHNRTAVVAKVLTGGFSPPQIPALAQSRNPVPAARAEKT